MVKVNTIITYNLQFFAKDGPGGEKTEPATAKKLTDARKEGQVTKSKELLNATGLITLFLVLKYLMEFIGSNLITIFGQIYNKIPETVKMYNGDNPDTGMKLIINNSMFKIILILLPIFLVAYIIIFILEVAQVKWHPTLKPLRPKFSKLNPIKGFNRIFSKDSLVELLKSVIKILMIVYVMYSTLKDKQGMIMLLYDVPLLTAVFQVGQIAINMGLKVSFFYLIIGLADFAYQKIKFREDMKMSKQEVKDEYMNTEGNPQIKGKIRNKMREASQRRMMQNVPKADVIITNPTHISVALKYDTDSAKAPIVLAKGEDYLALKIREAAKEHAIEIVENKPLARMLYANVEIGEEIPQELYQAVAEVLAFVYNLKNKG